MCSIKPLKVYERVLLLVWQQRCWFATGYLGLIAGYYGKWVDDMVQYFYTTISAIPGILLISAAILSLQVWLDKHASWFSSMTESDDMRLLIVCLILGLTGWTSLCRLLRAETLKIREMDYIAAAKRLAFRKAAFSTSIFYRT